MWTPPSHELSEPESAYRGGEFFFFRKVFKLTVEQIVNVSF